MKYIKFTITEDEIREVAESINQRPLSDKQIQLVLDMVEGDEMLAKDIRNSIIGSIHELFSMTS